MDGHSSNRTILTLTVERTGAGLYRATSPEVVGLHVCGKSLGELLEVAPLMVAALDEAYAETGRNPWPAIREALAATAPEKDAR